MKIAFVCEFTFSPPSKGVEVRLHHTADLLGEIGDVVPFIVTRLAIDPVRFDALRTRYEGAVHLIPSEEPPRSIFAKLARVTSRKSVAGRGYHLTDPACSNLVTKLREYDLVWFHSLKVADSIGVYKWQHGVVDLDDLHSQKYLQAARLTTNLVARVKNLWSALIWTRWERDALQRFAQVVVCSHEDRRFLPAASNVAVLPNVLESGHQRMIVRRPSPDRIGFIGTLEYFANQDALAWFISEILPMLVQERPGIRLRVAGAIPKGFTFPSNSVVEVLGYVNDLATEMATWSASVAPLRIGGGTRLKILESFMQRCPVVSTQLGCYGLGVTDKLELLVANSPRQFAKACADLCASVSLAETISATAFAHWKTNFTRESIRPTVGAIAASVSGVRTEEGLVNFPPSHK
jgi:glycosyltransferase involved in cell wall biosynthesis